MRVNRPHPGVPYFEAVGDRLGRAYLRYNFTKGTGQEVAFILELLNLEPEARVLDVGCGPGRHTVPLAAAGLAVTGIDISRRFLEIAADSATAAGVKPSLFVLDARQMPFEDEFDAVLALCEGGFGLMGADDGLVLRRMAEALRSGGRLVLTAINGYHEARHPRDSEFDIDSGIVHELTELRDEAGEEFAMDLWTSAYTPRELRLLAIGVGLIPEHVWGVSPGEYGRRPPDIDRPELMLVARKP